MAIRGLKGRAMIRTNMKTTYNNGIWYWTVFLFKSYVGAVPAAVLICQLVGQPVPGGTHDTYFRYLVYGYVICIAVISLDAIIAKSNKNKAAFRSAVLFLVMAVFLTTFFYLGTLVTPRK